MMRRAALLTVCLLTGCAQLVEVRDYASASEKLADYRVLTTRFRDTYQREQPYLSRTADASARDNDARRAAAYRSLLQIHRVVARYMHTLGRMAGERADSLGSAGGKLTEAIAALPELGISAKQADAYGKLTAQLSALASYDYQQQQLKLLVRSCDADLQTLLAAMSTLTRIYQQTNDNERKTVLGMLEVELAFTRAPKDRLLNTLARAQLQAKTAEYQAAQRKYGALDKGIGAIALGHKALLDNLEQLDHSATRAVVQEFVQQIRTSTELLSAPERDDTVGAP